MFHPGPGIEQDQHGQQFQSSGQHVEDQHQFGGEAVVSEVPGGPYPCQAGTDVVQGSGHSSEVGLEIEPVQAHGQDGQEENQEIGDQKDVDGIEHFAVHGLPVHAHPLDPVGMEYLSQFQENGLAGEHDPAHLHPAAGAAGAGPHHHQEHQDGFGKAGHRSKSTVLNPVVVMMLPTWKKADRRACSRVSNRSRICQVMASPEARMMPT